MKDTNNLLRNRVKKKKKCANSEVDDGYEDKKHVIRDYNSIQLVKSTRYIITSLF